MFIIINYDYNVIIIIYMNIIFYIIQCLTLYEIIMILYG